MNKGNNLVESSTIGAGLLWAALVVPALSGCEAKPANQVTAPTPEARLAQVVDHGEGVYEFRADKEFPRTLANFRRQHQQERIISVSQGLDYNAGIGNSSVGLSDSFIVVTEPESKLTAEKPNVGGAGVGNNRVNPNPFEVSEVGVK